MPSKVNLKVIPENAILICTTENVKNGKSEHDTFYRVVKNDGSKIKALQLKEVNRNFRSVKLSECNGLALTFNDKLESYIGYDCEVKCIYVVIDEHDKYAVNDNLLTEVRMIGRFKEYKIV